MIGNTAFNMSRTRTLSKYKKMATGEVYSVLEVQIRTPGSFRDIEFFSNFSRRPFLTAILEWHKKTFSVKFVGIVEV